MATVYAAVAILLMWRYIMSKGKQKDKPRITDKEFKELDEFLFGDNKDSNDIESMRVSKKKAANVKND